MPEHEKDLMIEILGFYNFVFDNKGNIFAHILYEMAKN